MSFPVITNPARPFRSVALESSRGHLDFESAIVGPDGKKWHFHSETEDE